MHRSIYRFARHARRSLRRLGRLALWFGAVLLLLLGAAVVALRLTLPSLVQNKAQIERYLSERSGHPIRIAKLEADWEGWRPALRVGGLEIFSPADLARAVRLGEIRISLAVAPLLWGELQIHQLVLVRPRLSLERFPDGRIEVSGLATAAPGRGAPGAALAWLLAQRQLVVEGAELQWFDHLGERRGLYLSNINVDLYNVGARHRLAVAARFPPTLCADCALTAELTGNPLAGEPWQGRVFIRAMGLDLAALPAVARERLPGAVAGKLDVRLWTTWDSGELRAAEGDVRAAALRLPLPGRDAGVGVQALRTDLNWSRKGEHWQLALDDLWLGLAGPEWHVGHVRIAGTPQGRLLRIDAIELADLTRFFSALELEHKALTWLKATRPSGRVEGLIVRVNGRGKALEDYAIEAAIVGLRMEPFRKIPGVKNLSGRLATEGRRGGFTLEAADLTVDVPRILRAPVQLASASGYLRWTIEAERWELRGEKLRVLAADGRGQGRFEARGDLGRPGDKPYLDLHVDFSEGNGAHASRYFPINVMSPATVAWLDRSIVDGRVTSGRLVITGDMDEFPFADGNGTFEVRVQVREAVFNYLPGWTPLTGAEGELLFRGPGMLITQERGAIGGLRVGRVIVRCDDLRKEVQPSVSVRGTIEGTVAETMRVLRAVPASEQDDTWRSYLELGTVERGEGVIDLKLEIPTRDPGQYAMSGEYAVSGANLRFRVLPLRAERVGGRVSFDRLGPIAGALEGQLLGGAAAVKISRGEAQSGSIALSGRGTFTTAGLAQAVPGHLPSYLDGHAPWRGEWEFGNGVDRLRLVADLSRVRSRFPAPLDRPAGIAESLLLTATGDAAGGRDVGVQIGERIHGRFLFAKQTGDWNFSRGSLGLGTEESPELPRAGLRVHARATHVDADPWFSVFKLGDRSPLPGFLQRLTGDFDSVTLLGRAFGKLAIDLSKGQNAWSGTLAGADAQGRIRLIEGRALPVERLELALERLQLPPRAPQAQRAEPDPRTLPSLDLRTESLRYEERDFGALDLSAERIAAGWRVSRLTLTRPETTLVVKGEWSRVSAVERTRVELQFTSFDMGTALEAWGLPEQMAGGKLTASATLAWRGSPTKPDLATLEGSAVLDGEKGRFLRLDPGAARLFGVLDFSAIGKFFTGDFGALFGKGFAFDRLRGELALEKGNVHTTNLHLSGPADLAFNGRVGLAAKDLDLAVRVTPSLGTNIGLWGILGPQGGLILLALEKLFKKQFAAGTSLTYLVKGPWESPRVERLGAPPGGEAPARSDN